MTGATDFEVEVSGVGTFHKKEITAFWYRRGHLSLAHRDWDTKDEPIPEQLRVHLQRECSSLEYIVHKAFEQVPHLNAYADNNINKTEVLGIAGRLGLSVPRTLVTDLRIELERFIKDCGAVVTKGLHSGFFFEEEGVPFEGMTREVMQKEVDSLADHFHVSLFQEKINKRYEIRAFYLAGKFHCMAIFSQANTRTSTDYRNHDPTNPNRTVPYRLPVTIEEMLTALMHQIGLNCGTIDIVRNVQGAYVFLEVNPIGQFGQVSISCNYALEMRVAQYLTCGGDIENERVSH